MECIVQYSQRPKKNVYFSGLVYISRQVIIPRKSTLLTNSIHTNAFLSGYSSSARVLVRVFFVFAGLFVLSASRALGLMLVHIWMEKAFVIYYIQHSHTRTHTHILRMKYHL